MTLLQENDIVEAVVDQSDDVWYRGRITLANSNKMTWNVEYDDEEVGFGLCQACVRPYVPYALNDSVEVLVDEEQQQFAIGRVVSINQLDGSYEVRVEDTSSSGKLLSNLKTKDFRRRLSRPGDVTKSGELLDLDVGSPVLAMEPGSEEDGWFPGVITRRILEGRYYSILYDDGEFVSQVPQNMVKPRSTSNDATPKGEITQ